MLAVAFSDVVTLGSVITLALVVVVAGLPFQLVRTLRTERDEWKGIAEDCTKRAQELEVKLASAEARTDQTPVLDKIERLVVAVHELAETSARRHQAFAVNLEATAKLTQGLVGQIAEQTHVLERIADHLDHLEHANGKEKA